MFLKLLSLFLSSLAIYASDSEKILQELKLINDPIIDFTRVVSDSDYLQLYLEDVEIYADSVFINSVSPSGSLISKQVKLFIWRK